MEPHQILRAFIGNGGLRGKLLNDTIFTGKDHPGLRAFFGTVECQGRGSLHLHMLVWLAGFPSPAELMRRINEFLKTFPLYNHDHPGDQCAPSPDAPTQPDNCEPTHQAPIGNTDLPASIPEQPVPTTSCDDHPQVSSNDPPDSPWLQPTWLQQVARYLESIIQQDYPRFSADEIVNDRNPAFLSKQATYFDQ